MIKVYYGKCKDIGINKIKNSLIVQKISKYNNQKEKDLKINAYYHLIKILKENNVECEFVYNSYEKPYLKNNELYFNISHSFNYFAIAISDSEVGIDIEKIRFFKKEKLMSLRERCMTKEEKEEFPETEKSFIELWTVKESFLKLLGIGINVPLDSISVKDDVSLEQKKAKYKTLEIDGYIITISSFENVDYEIYEIE